MTVAQHGVKSKRNSEKPVNKPLQLSKNVILFASLLLNIVFFINVVFFNNFRDLCYNKNVDVSNSSQQATLLSELKEQDRGFDSSTGHIATVSRVNQKTRVTSPTRTPGLAVPTKLLGVTKSKTAGSTAKLNPRGSDQKFRASSTFKRISYTAQTLQNKRLTILKLNSSVPLRLPLSSEK